MVGRQAPLKSRKSKNELSFFMASRGPFMIPEVISGTIIFMVDIRSADVHHDKKIAYLII